jgi:hypothetical protein
MTLANRMAAQWQRGRDENGSSRSIAIWPSATFALGIVLTGGRLRLLKRVNKFEAVKHADPCHCCACRFSFRVPVGGDDPS